MPLGQLGSLIGKEFEHQARPGPVISITIDHNRTEVHPSVVIDLDECKGWGDLKVVRRHLAGLRLLKSDTSSDIAKDGIAKNTVAYAATPYSYAVAPVEGDHTGRA